MTILGKIPFLKRMLAPAPQFVPYATLEITTVFPCAVACKICPQERLKGAYTGKNRLTLAGFSAVLDKIPTDVRIDFSGFSEPFLNRDAANMMLLAYRRGYRVALYTTLIGFDSADLALLKEVNFAACTLHVPDSTSFTVADEEKWLAAYRLFTSQLTYDNAVYHVGRLSPRLKREVGRLCRPPVLTRANNLDVGISRAIPRYRGVIDCAISGNRFRQNVMMPNGDVYLCCMDWSLQHRLGNLFDQAYAELYGSEEYQRVCRAVQNPEIETICRYCERSRGE